jgi:hypothetical protein
VFSMWSVPRYYKQWTRLALSQFCMGICEKGLEREAVEQPLLEPLTEII